MATVTKFATAASGTSWTTPTNANADDAAYATYTIAVKNTTGNQNTLSNFGFDGSIPVGSTINSVALEVQHKVSTNGGIAYLECAVAIGATLGTTNSDSLEPTTDTIRTYSALTRPGGGSWTRTDLLNGTFTTRLWARSGNSATSVTYSWDYAKVTVDYTPQNFALTCNSGTYSKTGQSATLLRSKLLTASSGSYSKTGQSAILVKGRVLVTQNGTYTFTGQDAVIIYTPLVGYTLTAQSGSYSYTGQDASLIKGFSLVAQNGSYSKTGQSATILKSRLITASNGSYTYTGRNCVITYSTGSSITYWNGVAFVAGTLQRWDGASWVAATIKRWNGSTWV